MRIWTSMWMPIRMLHAVASAPAGLKRILPISASAKRKRILPTSTLFTPTHERRMPQDLSNPFITPCPSQYSTCLSRDGVDDQKETHSYHCFCIPRWPSEEEEPIQFEPLQEEELLETLLFWQEESLLIEKGGHVDLQRLLFTQERDFLMKSNGQKVKMDGLSKKHVLLYIFPLVSDHRMILMTRELVRLRNSLQDQGCLEIVFVGLGSDTDSTKQQKIFKAYSSQMTWPFIPFEDHDARERVRSTFGFSKDFLVDIHYLNPYCGIVDPTGKLLQSWAWDILNYYGHDAFPFTDEKIFSLYKEEAYMFAEGVSLKALLGTSNRDYVLSAKGDKVPIQDLEDKVVCIILYDPTLYADALIEGTFKKNKVYAHPDFIPVLVCRHFTDTYCSLEYMHIDDQAKKEFESVGWLRIPYGDSSVRKIWRVILRRCNRSKTICNIVGPHGSYVDHNTLSYIENYGSEAYPFTTRRAAELKAQKLQVNFLLEDFLQSIGQINRNDGLEVVLHPDCRIYCRGGQKDGDASVLYNKRLLVFFGTRLCCELGQFLCELKLLYNQKKGTDEEFEVIYISLDCVRSDFDKSTSRMPWFVCPFGRKEEVLKFLPFTPNIPTMMAFERDGLLVGMERHVHLKKDKRPHFPYINRLADEFMEIHQPLDDETEYEVCDFWRIF